MPKKRTRRQRRKSKRQHREATQTRRSVEPIDERRGIVVEATGIDGVPLDEPHILTVIEPIRLPTGEDLYFQSPFVAPFYLLKAKKLRDPAERRRVKMLANAARTDDGTLRPLHPSTAFDVLEDLALAVILAVAAIEVHANDMIGRLPDDAMVDIPTRLAGQTVAVMRNKRAMDWLPLSDKLARATPLLHGSESIKGTAAWQKYKRLSRIRNNLVHQRREAVSDPLKPSAFGRLLLGEGSDAPEDAALIIEALEPGYLPDPIRRELGLQQKTATP